MIKETTVYHFKIEEIQTNQPRVGDFGCAEFSFDGQPFKVFNPVLAAIFGQRFTPGRVFKNIDEFTLLPDGSTDIKTTRHWEPVNEKGVDIVPLMEAYCTGYQKARAEMEKQYPNPPVAAKDLKVIFKNLRKVRTSHPIATTTEAMSETGELGGMYSMILDWAIMYPESLKNVVMQPENKPGKQSKKLPDFKDIFIGDETILNRLVRDEDCRFDRNTGQYHWDQSLDKLGGFTHMMKKKNRFRTNQRLTNPDLGRIVCKFFNFEMSNEKAFQPGRARRNSYHFNWITDFPVKS